MADNHTAEQRHINMSRIRSMENAPEVLVRKKLFACGFRYRKNVKTLPGCPDIVLPKYRTVIFINGCFWHMHDCGLFHWPQSNAEYWEKKIRGNAERDVRNHDKLRKQGWNILIVWECQLKKVCFDETMQGLCEDIRRSLTLK